MLVDHGGNLDVSPREAEPIDFESADHVVLVPARHVDDHRCAGLEPRHVIVSQPIPCAIAVRLRLGKLAPLDQIVGDHQTGVAATAGDFAADAGSLETALENRAPVVYALRILGQRQIVAAYQRPHASRRLLREPVAEGRVEVQTRRVDLRAVREPLRECLGFAATWRHRDRGEHRTASRLLDQVDQRQ